MGNEIQLYEKLNNPMEAVVLMGKSFAKSGMFGCDRQEQGEVLAMMCIFENKPPSEIMRNNDIIGGKLRKKSISCFSDYRGRGGKVKWIKTGDDGKEAKAVFTFEGESLELAYTIEMAKQQQLVRDGGNWVKTPGNMLRARLITNAIAMLCPEVYTGDDFEDTTPPPAPEIKLATVVSSEPIPAPAPFIPVAQTEPVKATPATEQPPINVTPAATTQPVLTLAQKAIEALAGHYLEATTWFNKQGRTKIEGVTNELEAAQWCDAHMVELPETLLKSIVERQAGFIRTITGGVK